MSRDATLREHLIELLTGGGAHLSFDDAVDSLPPDLRGAKIPHVPHTPWRLVEHLRIAQHDILEFSRSPDWESPDWPEGYWPQGEKPSDDQAWQRSVETFRSDLSEMVDLVRDPANDLLAPIPHGQGQTLAREAMLLADHNAYHIGQLIVIRRGLRAWEDA